MITFEFDETYTFNCKLNIRYKEEIVGYIKYDTIFSDNLLSSIEEEQSKLLKELENKGKMIHLDTIFIKEDYRGTGLFNEIMVEFHKTIRKEDKYVEINLIPFPINFDGTYERKVEVINKLYQKYLSLGYETKLIFKYYDDNFNRVIELPFLIFNLKTEESNLNLKITEDIFE